MMRYLELGALARMCRVVLSSRCLTISVASLHLTAAHTDNN
jgi:hypothetical protein